MLTGLISSPCNPYSAPSAGSLRNFYVIVAEVQALNLLNLKTLNPKPFKSLKFLNLSNLKTLNPHLRSSS